MIVTHTGATPGQPVGAQMLVPNGDGTYGTVQTKEDIVHVDGSWRLHLESPTEASTVASTAFWVITEPTPSGFVTWSVYVTGTGSATVNSLTAAPYNIPTGDLLVFDGGTI